eukprot:TRINITY_DN5318_c0_g1_i5.p2 TRINITY_DN5318_c0_g1~~TRINITY_DN5318_c0_g1_i5.p2  ORF type:complete len:184 (+),score=35.72 TRINITY_DN5318_c0_g1_i5:635-1186(+)
MRTIEPLRATSLLGNGILAYTAGLVVVRYATGAPPEGGVARVVLSAGTLQALPSVLFAFNFHYNVPVYYAQLKGRSPRRMLRIVVAAYATVACLYVIIGAAGYFALGAATRSNIVMSLAAGVLSYAPSPWCNTPPAALCGGCSAGAPPPATRRWCTAWGSAPRRRGARSSCRARSQTSAWRWR